MKHIQRSIVAIASLIGCSCMGQWSSVGSGFDHGVRSLTYDPVSGRIYTFGTMRRSGEITVNGSAYWDGEQWGPMGEGLCDDLGDPPVASIMIGVDSLLVSGFFRTAIGVPDTRYTALWDGAAWQSIGPGGSRGIAWGMLANEDGVTMAGALDSVAGVPVNDMARYTNGMWGSLCTYPDDANSLTHMAVVKFQGKYIFGGNYNIPDLHEIGWLDNDTLRQLGEGIRGDAWVNDLAVFQNKLFVGGEFYAGAGNAGSALTVWDGNGFADPVPGVQFTTQVVDLDVRNGELYISGRSMLPGSPDFYSLARYDGERICLFGKNLNTVFLALAATDTELFTAPNMITLGLGGDTVNYIVRYALDHPADTGITLSVGMTQQNGVDQPWTFSPNPFQDRITIGHKRGIPANSRLVLHDALGNLVWRGPLTSSGSRAVMDVPPSISMTGIVRASVIDANGAVLVSRTLLALRP